jgi:hypothetical protein
MYDVSHLPRLETTLHQGDLREDFTSKKDDSGNVHRCVSDVLIPRRGHTQLWRINKHITWCTLQINTTSERATKHLYNKPSRHDSHDWVLIDGKAREPSARSDRIRDRVF